MKCFGGILISVALLAETALSSQVFYVDRDFKGLSSTGASWHSAFTSLQQAIDTAPAGNEVEIWVKAGVYKPSGDTRNATFELKPNIALYGGFRGNETDRKQRNPWANRTVLSGDIGRIGNPADNCYHVVTGAGNGRLDGFIISSGNADGKIPFGGALLLDSKAKGFISANCTFEKSQAKYGGALYLSASGTTLSNCTFYANSAGQGGALFLASGASLKAVDCKFTSNYAEESGGAVVLQDATQLEIDHSWFQLNRSAGHGGGVAGSTKKWRGIELKLTDCEFSENSATGSGGGLYADGPFAPELTRCRFTRNSSTQGAAAVTGRNNADVSLIENTLSLNNSATGINDIDCTPIEKIAAVETPPTNVVVKVKSPDKSRPKPKRRIAKGIVYDVNNVKVDLLDLVAKKKYTVIAVGDLTDPAFIASYRNVEAAARDYASEDIGFFYLYSYLLHPENNGYVKPVTLEERGQHIHETKRLFRTRIPWLCDSMENTGSVALNRSKHSLVILGKDGVQEFAGQIDDEDSFRKALQKLAGPSESTTSPKRFTAPELEPVDVSRRRVVKRVNIRPGRGHYTALRSVPVKSRNPCYVKVRAEADKQLLANGSGSMYLGFHIDPLYQLEWNNLDQPLEYVIKVPRGAAISPSHGRAPKINGVAIDSEAREFFLEIRKWNPEIPMPITVTYTLTSIRSQRSTEITQRFLIGLQRDPFGGTVLGRQVVVPKKWSVKESVYRP